MLFQTEHLSGAGGKVKDVSIQVKKGEVVGIAGLVGAGKSELCKTIFGAYKRQAGKSFLKNRGVKDSKSLRGSKEQDGSGTGGTEKGRRSGK